MFDDTSPIFQQLADSLADEVLRGLYAEGDQVPSINELAAFHRINPATANRAVALLVDQGVLIKRRGVGMFVADGALNFIADEVAELELDREVDAGCISLRGHSPCVAQLPERPAHERNINGITFPARIDIGHESLAEAFETDACLSAALHAVFALAAI